MQRLTYLIFCVFTSGCGAATQDAPEEAEPPAEVADGDAEAKEPEGPQLHQVKGTVDRIELQNINKLGGEHLTFNVHVWVRYDSIEPMPDKAPVRENPDGSPTDEAVLKVRLDHKPTYKGMSDEERQALFPSGPQPQISPQRYGGYAVGDPIELQVRFTGANLAHRVP